MSDSFRQVGERGKRSTSYWNGWIMLCGFSLSFLIALSRGPVPGESVSDHIGGCVFLVILIYIAWRCIVWGGVEADLMDENPYRAPQTNTGGRGQLRWLLLVRLAVYIPHAVLAAVFFVWAVWEVIRLPHLSDNVFLITLAVLWNFAAIWLIRRSVKDYRHSAPHC